MFSVARSVLDESWSPPPALQARPEREQNLTELGLGGIDRARCARIHCIADGLISLMPISRKREGGNWREMSDDVRVCQVHHRRERLD